MDQTIYGPLNTTLSTYESRLLDENSFNRLMSAGSLDQAGQTLQDTPYREIAEKIEAGEDYNPVFIQVLEDLYQDLEDQLPDSRLFEWLTLRYTYHNLKVMIKQSMTDQNLEDLLIDIGPYSLKQLDRAVHEEGSQVLPEPYQDVIRDYQGDEPAFGQAYEVDFILDRAYLNHARDLSKDIGDPFVEKVTQYAIDRYNTMTTARAVRRGRGSNYLASLLVSGGSLDPEVFLNELSSQHNRGDSFIEAHPDLVQASLGYVPDFGDEDPLVTLDRHYDDRLMTEMAEAKFDIFGLKPVIAFSHAVEIEVMNLRIVLAGLKAGVSEDQLRERMRDHYGL